MMKSNRMLQNYSLCYTNNTIIQCQCQQCIYTPYIHYEMYPYPYPYYQPNYASQTTYTNNIQRPKQIIPIINPKTGQPISMKNVTDIGIQTDIITHNSVSAQTSINRKSVRLQTIALPNNPISQIHVNVQTDNNQGTMPLQTLTAASSSTYKINENYTKINIEPIYVVSSSTSNNHLNDVKADTVQKSVPLQILTATNSSNSNFHLNDENNDIKQISAPLQIITAPSSTSSSIQINDVKSNNINPTPVSLQTKPVPNTSKIPLHLNDEKIKSNQNSVSLQTKPVPSTSKIPRGQKKSKGKLKIFNSL